MLKYEATDGPSVEFSAEAIRQQLDLLVQDQGFRSSKRSVQFLTYVVEQTLKGSADQIKERTIGVEVFGREPSYDTNVDHVVRTAAVELRKRLATYYDEERHRSELRMSLVPGSYIPRFTLPPQAPPVVSKVAGSSEAAHFSFQISPHDVEPEVAVAQDLPPAPVNLLSRMGLRVGFGVVALLILVLTAGYGYARLHSRNDSDLFWMPVLESPGSVLLAVGNVPNGPPTPSAPEGDQGTSIPIVHKTSALTVPFSDAVTFAHVFAILQSHGKKVIIRKEGLTSFSDLREGPVVLIGAFNNEWSLRLTRQLQYTLALDDQRHVIYIRDAKNPTARNWSWATDQATGQQGRADGPAVQDYALISRIWNSETGHVVIIIGGLYTYGTEAAGELLSDAQLMREVAKVAPLADPHRNLQIVLGTTVTDNTPGPPRVLAVSAE
ncbi:hypothetical protein [Granulicella sp. dw_53]|uniref:hypothetical protein n=1 Tax=Granulicella sp. dw_53 TaxID=2719792 RepID=UPI001BD5371C|nr:hypothetical protein [Granulicella sp. dw_53]